MESTRSSVACLAFVLALLVASPFGTQPFRGTMLGVVTDPTGEVLPGVRTTIEIFARHSFRDVSLPVTSSCGAASQEALV